MKLRSRGNYDYRIEYLCASYCENTFVHAHMNLTKIKYWEEESGESEKPNLIIIYSKEYKIETHDLKTQKWHQNLNCFHNLFSLSFKKSLRK